MRWGWWGEVGADGLVGADGGRVGWVEGVWGAGSLMGGVLLRGFGRRVRWGAP